MILNNKASLGTYYEVAAPAEEGHYYFLSTCQTKQEAHDTCARWNEYRQHTKDPAVVLEISVELIPFLTSPA